MLEKLEEEAEYAAAKAELEELQNTAMEKIETYKRRYDWAFCCTDRAIWNLYYWYLSWVWNGTISCLYYETVTAP